MRRGPGRVSAAVALLAVLLPLAACAATPSTASGLAPPSTRYAGVAFVDDLDYGGPEGMRIDVCLPEGGAAGAPAVLSVHGGGWRAGDKAQRPWRDVCAWLASEGFVVFQPNYRLAPAHPYPAAIDDVSRAVAWIGHADQVARFGHDPERLAGFGDSAGGNLVSLLGTRGTGGGSDARLDAVVELSAPIDLTRAGAEASGLGEDFQRVQLDYLGCASYDDCAVAEEASPVRHVDPGDPPFFIAHSTDEFIPFAQAEAFAAALESAAVDVTVVPVEGEEHALGVLDDALRARIVEWLRDRLSA